MGQVFSRYLAGGYTAADWRAAMLALATELYGGAPSYYGVNNLSPYGYNIMEWPDFGGLKVFWNRTGSTTMSPTLANSVNNPTTRTYRGPVSQGNLPFDPADKSQVAYIVGVKGEDYVLFATQQSGTVFNVNLIAKMRPLPVWAGAISTYIANNRINVGFTPGRNPWGSLDSNGNASSAGLDSGSVLVSQSNDLNTLVNSRQLIKGHYIFNAQAFIGYTPEDFGQVAYFGQPNYMVMLDCGVDGLYLRLPGTTAAGGWCVKVDAAPFSGMEVFSAYVFDMAQPVGGETGECEPEWPSYGQKLPNPRALKMRQVTP